MRPAHRLAVVGAVLSSLAVGCGAGESRSSAPSRGTADALPAGAVVIYDEALRSGWVDWSWGTTRNWAATSPVGAGARSIAVTYTPWGALNLRRSGASIAGMSALSLMVHGGGSSGVELEVIGVAGSSQLTRVGLAQYCDARAIPTSAWTRCRVPFSAIGPAGTVFDGFQIQSRAGTSRPVFFDDIGLLGASTPTPTVPAAPSNLAAAVSTGAVSLSWGAVSGATGYDVFRGTASAGPFTKLTAAPQATTTYRDASVSAGITYWYRVAAVNGAGAGPASGVVSAAVPAPPVVTISPASLTADACRTAKLSAAVTGAADGSVAWSIQEGAAGGTVDASGNYTAPSSAGTYHVVARSNAWSAAFATATVTVRDRILSVSVAPAATSVAAGAEARLTANVTTTCGTFAAQ